MQVRSVTGEDFRVVSALLAELGRPEVLDATADACRDGYEADVSDPGADHLVAVGEADEVLGFCSLHYRSRLNHTTEEAWIPDLIVAEDARGTGIGGALLAEAERRARERGCHALTLESAYHRTRAHRFYLAAGMTDAAKSFFKPLGS